MAFVGICGHLWAFVGSFHPGVNAILGLEGTIRFFGQLDGKLDQPRVGIELDDPVGDTDGTVDGHRYFECAQAGLYGVLVEPNTVTCDGEADSGSAVESNTAPPSTAVPSTGQKRKASDDDDDGGSGTGADAPQSRKPRKHKAPLVPVDCAALYRAGELKTGANVGQLLQWLKDVKNIKV